MNTMNPIQNNSRQGALIKFAALQLLSLLLLFVILYTFWERTPSGSKETGSGGGAVQSSFSGEAEKRLTDHLERVAALEAAYVQLLTDPEKAGELKEADRKIVQAEQRLFLAMDSIAAVRGSDPARGGSAGFERPSQAIGESRRSAADLRILLAASGDLNPADALLAGMQQDIRERDRKIEQLQNQLRNQPSGQNVASRDNGDLETRNANLRAAMSELLTKNGILTRQYNQLKQDNERLVLQMRELRRMAGGSR